MVSIDGAEASSVEVGSSALVCDLIHAALATLGGPPMSVAGVLEGWFRAESGGAHAPGDEPVSELSEGPVSLSFQAATLVPMAVEVLGDEPASFRTPVNTALTAGAVARQICASLELSDVDWHISVQGQGVLPPLQTLGDALTLLDDPSDVTLVVET